MTLREQFEEETGEQVIVQVQPYAGARFETINGACSEEYTQWVESKLTTHNSQYAKCLECDERQANNPKDSYCGNCGRHFA